MKFKELSFERNMPGLVLSAVYSIRGRNLHELKIKIGSSSRGQVLCSAHNTETAR